MYLAPDKHPNIPSAADFVAEEDCAVHNRTFRKKCRNYQNNKNILVILKTMEILQLLMMIVYLNAENLGIIKPCSSDFIKPHISQKFPEITEIYIEKLPVKNKNQSFETSIELQHKESIITPSVWPKGVISRRVFTVIGQTHWRLMNKIFTNRNADEVHFSMYYHNVDYALNFLSCRKQFQTVVVKL